ncbi:protein LYK5-like [Vicia villosa]|uniref:protein LYK5-like n=1 Tax=Vicia villosa TaxID=3911 RepID=UPI00273BE820|nr:protein LYK5-like [Vicia villosa]
MTRSTLLTLIILTTFISNTLSQQEYVGLKQPDCDHIYNSTLGNICNSVNSCQSYLTFNSNPSYNTSTSISNLLNASSSLVSQSNNISTLQIIPSNTIITVPVTCSCSGNNKYYQHNATYTLNTLGETYFSVANYTYQTLTSCQALIAQNPYGIRNLTVGLNITVPLRCACPTKKQTDQGFKYLLTYLISDGDTVSSIADIFGVDQQSILDANELSSTSTIYAFSPLSVPLKTEPPKKITRAASPPESPPPPPPVDSGSSSSKKWIIVGVVVGVVVLLLVILAVFSLCFYKRKQPPKLPPPAVQKLWDSNAKKTTSTTQSWSLSSEGIRYAVDSLTQYKFQELQNATMFFSEENKIKGSVYKASFKGDAAAVKILKGDVSSEINILKRINHANIIRLSGFCVYKGNTYLVYEFAENKSLDDWLHSEDSNSTCLSWFQRVQIAHDVADALNYLHNYANPPHVHKNLKTENILLDGKFRGKVSNFGLARVMENDSDEGFQLTRHVIGTQGYMAPEYIENGLITPKMDVFAFGVVILELLSGREVVGGDKNNGLGDQLLSSTVNQVLEGENDREKLRGFMDPNLRDEYPMDLAYSMAEIAKRCVARDLNSRPNVSEVFMVLSKIQSSTLDWDPSSRSVSQVSDS